MERAIYISAGVADASLRSRRQNVIDELIAGAGSYPVLTRCKGVRWDVRAASPAGCRPFSG